MYGETRNFKESCRAWYFQKEDMQCDQVRTEKPVAHDVGTFDFKIQGLSHSTVEEGEHVLVHELINRIENHPHRDE